MPNWEAYTPENNACMVFNDVPHLCTEEPDEKMKILIQCYLRRNGC